MVKRTNKALELVRLIGRKPDTYAFEEACAVPGGPAGRHQDGRNCGRFGLIDQVNSELAQAA